MKYSNLIEWKKYRQPEPFDFEAYNRRAEARYRGSEIRAWITHVVDTAVTAIIGVCTVFCMYLVITML